MQELSSSGEVIWLVSLPDGESKKEDGGGQGIGTHIPSNIRTHSISTA